MGNKPSKPRHSQHSKSSAVKESKALADFYKQPDEPELVETGPPVDKTVKTPVVKAEDAAGKSPKAEVKKSQTKEAGSVPSTVEAKGASRVQPQPVEKPAESKAKIQAEPKTAEGEAKVVGTTVRPTVTSSVVSSSSSSSTTSSPPLETKRVLSNASTSYQTTLRPVLSFDDYFKNATLKPTPGLLFKDVLPFQPLTPATLVNQEVDNLSELALRLRDLRRTLQHDLIQLNGLDAAANRLDAQEDKAVISTLTARNKRRLSQQAVGTRWTQFQADNKATLGDELSRLSCDERLEVVAMLGELQQQLSQYEQERSKTRQRAHGFWVQVRTAVSFGTFGKAQQAKNAAAVRVDETTSSVSTAPLEKTSTTARDYYDAALLAHDRRQGWAKLAPPVSTADSKKETKESKEDKSSQAVVEQKSSASSTSAKDNASFIPPAFAQLRQNLAHWLGVSQTGTSTGSVQLMRERLFAIQDYCQLAHRVSECSVHLQHETQLARRVVAEFKSHAFKDDPELIQAISQLAIAQDPELLRALLGTLIDSIKSASLLQVHVLQGLATVLTHSRAEDVSLGDLHTILNLVVERTTGIGSDLSEADTLQLMQTLGALLSLMALISQQRDVQLAARAAAKDKTAVGAGHARDNADKVDQQAGSAKTGHVPDKALSLLTRAKGYFQTKADAVKTGVSDPVEDSGIAVLNQKDYEALCNRLQEAVIGSVHSRYGNELREKNPELYFAVALIRQALMRIAHKKPPRSERILQGALQFFTALEAAKDAVTSFSLPSLISAGTQLVDLVNASPFGEKLKALFAEEEARPQPWFEQFLILKTLVDSDQLPQLETALVQAHGVDLAYPLALGTLQLLDGVVRTENRSEVRKAAIQLLNLLASNQLWQWPTETAEFAALQKHLQQKCEKDYASEGRLTLEQRGQQHSYQRAQRHSQVALRTARRHCQDSDLRFQLHDYCLSQTRQANQDAQWLQDNSRYIPALAKPRLDVPDDDAQLFYPAFDAFRHAGRRSTTAASPLPPIKESKEIVELETKESQEDKSSTWGTALVPATTDNAQSVLEMKTDKTPEHKSSALSTAPLTKAQSALLILGDAGTGKSLFLRRSHLTACARYISRQFDQASDSATALGNADYPLSFHVYLNQSPVENPLEHHLQQQGFTEDQIRQLKDQGQILVHLDGYDEWSTAGQNPWVFGPKTLGSWVSSRCQVIVACRSQHIQGAKDYKDYFTPPRKDAAATANTRDASALAEWIITCLDEGGVAQLTAYYVQDEQAQGKSPWSQERYLQQFHDSGIQALVRTPIILLMALQVLPTLQKRLAKEARILRLDIYQEFISQYLQTQRSKQLTRGTSHLTGVIESAERYAQALALALFSQEKAAVSYQPKSRFTFAPQHDDPWARFFADGSPDQLLSNIIPLRVNAQRNVQEGSTTTQYSFIHKSMLDYFTALGLYQAIEDLASQLEETPPAAPTSTLPASQQSMLPVLMAASVQATTDPALFLNLAIEWEAAERYAQACHQWQTEHQQRLIANPLSRRAVSTERSVVEFIDEILQDHSRRWEAQYAAIPESLSIKGVKEDKETKATHAVNQRTRASSPREQLKARLTRIILASREYPELAQAAGNAATLLNACRYRFAGEAWPGVRIKGAYLVGSYWHRMDLKGATLEDCDLSASWWQDCDLRGAQFSRIRWGEFPSVEATGKASAIAVNPVDVNQLAIASGKDILLYDRAHGVITHTMRRGTEDITCLAYAPGGEQLASASSDRTVRLWDPRGGQYQTPTTLRGHEGDVVCLQYAPGGEQLASGSWDNTVRLWDPRGGEKQTPTTLRGHEGEVYCLAYAPGGGQLASGSANRTVFLWNPRGGKDQTPTILRGHADRVSCLAYAPGGEQLASSSYNTVRLWDPRGGEAQTPTTLRGHGQYVTCLAYAPGGEQLASGSSDNTVRLWNPRGGAKQTPVTLRGHEDMGGYARGVYCLAYAPGGGQLASGSEDKTVRLWDPRGGEKQTPTTLRGHESYVCCLQYAPEGGQLASGSQDYTVRLWDPRGGEKQTPTTLRGHEHYVYCLAYAPGGGQLASASHDKIALLDPRGGESQTPTTLRGHEEGVTCLAYAPGGEQLASGSWDKTVRLWDPRGGESQTPTTLSGHEGTVSCLAYAPGGGQLASASGDKSVRLWDPRGGEVQTPTTLRGHEHYVYCLAYAPGGGQLASGSGDIRSGELLLWDPRGGEKQTPTTLRGHEQLVYCLAYAPGGEQLASGGQEKTVRLWDPRGEADQTPTTLSGHEGTVSCLAYAPGGEQLASGSGDKTVRLWDPRGGEKQTPITLRGHEEEIRCLAYAPGGEQLASDSKKNNTVRLWDTRTGACLQVIPWVEHITALCWGSIDTKSVLFIGGESGTLAAFVQGPRGFCLAWVRNSRLPVLSFKGCQLSGAVLSSSEQRLLEQRGGSFKEAEVWAQLEMIQGLVEVVYPAHVAEHAASRAHWLQQLSFYRQRSEALSASERPQEDSWHRFFSEDCPDQLLARLMRQRIHAQRQVQEGSAVAQYRFIHQALQEYFTAHGLMAALDDVIACLDTLPSQPEKLRATPWYTHPFKFEPAVVTFLEDMLTDQDRVWQTTQQTVQNVGMRESKGRGVMVSPADKTGVSTSPRARFGARLIQVVQASRHYPQLAQASSNAATVLNALGFSLANQQWQGVQLAGADLSYCVLAHSDLRGANLRGASLCRSVLLSNANLAGADLRDVNWSEYLPLQLKEAVLAIAHHPTEPWLAVIQDKDIVLLHRGTGKQIGQVMRGHTASLRGIAFSPDGTRLASGGKDSMVRLWDVASQRALGEPMRGHSDCVRSVAFSPDSTRLASGGDDNTLQLWSVASQTPLGKSMSRHTDRVWSVAFSPDGTRLASTSGDQTVRLWDVASQTQLGEPMSGHTGEVNSVAFSPDGTRLASASDDHTVRLWDVVSQTPLGKPMKGHTAEVVSVAFSPDGRRLASASDDHTVQLWDVASQTALGDPMRGHTSQVSRIAFSADGTCLVSGSYDNTVRLWFLQGFRDAQLRGCQMSALSKHLLEQDGVDVSEVVVVEEAAPSVSKLETKSVSDAKIETKETKATKAAIPQAPRLPLAGGSSFFTPRMAGKSVTSLQSSSSQTTGSAAVLSASEQPLLEQRGEPFKEFETKKTAPKSLPQTADLSTRKLPMVESKQSGVSQGQGVPAGILSGAPASTLFGQSVSSSVGAGHTRDKAPADPTAQRLLAELQATIDQLYPADKSEVALQRAARLATLKPYSDREVSLTQDDRAGLRLLKWELEDVQDEVLATSTLTFSS